MKELISSLLNFACCLCKSKSKIVLICVVCYAILFNLEISPFKYVVPSFPFSECSNNELSLDTCVYLYMGNLIPQGLMPYRDAFDHKGPLLYLIIALGIRIGNLAGVWLVQVCSLFISVFYLYRTSRLLVPSKPAAFAAILAVLWYSSGYIGPEVLSIPFLSFTLFYFIRYILDGYRISIWETLLVGVCFGAVGFLKVNLTSLWLIFFIVVAMASIIKRDYIPLFCHVFFFLLGTILVSVPILFWLFIKGAFPDFINDYWKFNLFVYGDNPSISNYLSFFFDRRLSVWIFDRWFNLPALLVYIFAFWRTKSASRKVVYACMTFYLLLSILLLGIKGTSMSYYCLPLTVAYLVFFAISFDSALKITSEHAVLGVILLALISVPAIPSLGFPVAKDWVKLRLIAKYWPESENKYSIPVRTDGDVLDLADWIRNNTKKDLTLAGSNASVFWHSKRLCASKFFYFPPTKNCNELAYERIFGSDDKIMYPEYIFVTRKTSVTLTLSKIRHPKPVENVYVHPKIEETLAEKYDLVYQNERFDLYKRKPD